jgi:hypothetical protein
LFALFFSSALSPAACALLATAALTLYLTLLFFEVRALIYAPHRRRRHPAKEECCPDSGASPSAAAIESVDDRTLRARVLSRAADHETHYDAIVIGSGLVTALHRCALRSCTWQTVRVTTLIFGVLCSVAGALRCAVCRAV